MQVKVSIIVACYNQSQYLDDCLNSVINQSYAEWECIIVNDGSNDETDELANKWVNRDNRFRYFEKKNGGVSSARNFGIKQSSGKYILPLDGDDYIHEDYIEVSIRTIESNPEISLVYSLVEKFGLENYQWNLGKYAYQKLLVGNLIFSTALFKREDFDKTSGYDESMKDGLEDWEFWIRLLNEDSKVFQIQKLYFFYRIKAQSKNRITPEMIEKIKLFIYLKHIDTYTKYFKSPISILEENSNLKSMYKMSLDYKFGHLLINPFRRILKKIILLKFRN
ncbi:glycosyltransferase family A protein [Pedobacter sp. BMA]|uniref:glycosyltransferase family 2 protein n=1 Tax=Pedobacter sp. BMA TaxID=1663685 RepID=UPI000649E51D|nr:glycosyltransferase family A protein [Pedobacter sp. BMA]KLT66623.1 hypothetical protein AB669_05475 [Pedobacter sp. BMA]